MKTVTNTEARRVEFESSGLGTTHLVDGEETGGRFSVVEHDLPARTLGAPMHTHEREDEYSYVLSGRIGVQVGDDVTEAGPGQLVFKPRGIPHAFWNPGDEEARLLEVISPGGFEQYFDDLAPLLGGGQAPDFQRLGEVQARYGLSMDMESMGPLVERHGLRA